MEPRKRPSGLADEVTLGRFGFSYLRLPRQEKHPPGFARAILVTVHSHLLHGNESWSGLLAEEGLDCIFNEGQTVPVESSAGFDDGENHTHVLAA